MNFFDNNFLLKNKTAKQLFFGYAKDMPIFDFYCHLEPKQIYENKPFENITQVWLASDHYKWRLMRAMGINEELITGNAPDLEKFKAFAKTLEYAMGSPVYHWAHMELKAYFGINDPLTQHNAENIYNIINQKLNTQGQNVRDFLVRSNIKTIFTIDDPIHSLYYHKLLNRHKCEFDVIPTFRPDAILNIEDENFIKYLDKLENIANIKINSYENLKDALKRRLKYFNTVGCISAAHDIPRMARSQPEINLERVFKKILRGDEMLSSEVNAYKFDMMYFFAKEYASLNWVMQIHYGITRNISKKAYIKLGANSGYDVINNFKSIDNFAYFFNKLNKKDVLPKTIVFNADANDNYALASILGSFQDEGAVSKMQFGTAWGYNYHINGITKQIKTLSDVGLLGKFIGMLTDSRSFLSDVRHEYFRRILCNIVGEWIEDGSYNPDIEKAGAIVQDICFNNAVEYFRKQ